MKRFKRITDVLFLLVLIVLIGLFFIVQCSCQLEKTTTQNFSPTIIVAAENTSAYFSLLQNKKIAVVANHTSMINNKGLVDSINNAGFFIEKIFSPEHGYKGNADAGKEIGDSLDSRNRIEIISLYGKNKKPSAEQLKNIEVVVFDLQDVGTRFYTYLSTMYYMMEACAINGIEFIVLDRPNPNGFYVDGPVLEKDFESFVGLLPIPIVHGMTLGELSLMINAEGWLPNKAKCNLTVIKCLNYNHSMIYMPTVPPSPNLKELRSILLYPSLCLFEGTVISVGRGTDKPFMQFGHPLLLSMKDTFTPISIMGSIDPPLKNEICRGIDLTNLNMDTLIMHKQINLSYLIEAYNAYPDKSTFFNSFFNKLAGQSNLMQQIKNCKSEKEIRSSWQPFLTVFKEKRKKYLLYPDFIE